MKSYGKIKKILLDALVNESPSRNNLREQGGGAVVSGEQRRSKWGRCTSNPRAAPSPGQEQPTGPTFTFLQLRGPIPYIPEI